MEEQSLKDKTAKGLLWGGLSNGLIQVLGALFGIVLLNILSPSDYGKIAVLLVFSNIAGNLQESGFIAALCNKKNPRHEDYNAVFWFGLFVSVIVYCILFWASPLIAEFYHEPVLVPLARYLFLGFVISSFGTVQQAYLFRNMMVKQISLINVIALIISNIFGVVMACCGFAFWGLATQSILYILVVVISKWIVSPWRPSFNINLRPAWKMFGFSFKLLLTNFFNQLNSQVFSILLGKYFTTQMVGYYSNARKWDDMACTTINGMVNGVAQPVLAQVNDDVSRYRQVFRKMLRFTCFISFPCMFGLAIIAKEFILIAVGEKWADSADLLSILCVYGAFFPVSTLYSNLAISRGKSGINMFCMVSICVIVWIGLIALHPYGVHVMVIFFTAVNILWLLVWQYFAWRLVGLSYFSVAKDILPFLIFTLIVMGISCYVGNMIENIYLSITTKILLAASLYCGLTYISGAKIMRESINYIRHKS